MGVVVHEMNCVSFNTKCVNLFYPDCTCKAHEML